jgi:hypothetical protein
VRKEPPESSTFSMDCRATAVSWVEEGRTGWVAQQDMYAQEADQGKVAEIAVEGF